MYPWKQCKAAAHALVVLAWGRRMCGPKSEPGRRCTNIPRTRADPFRGREPMGTFPRTESLYKPWRFVGSLVLPLKTLQHFSRMCWQGVFSGHLHRQGFGDSSVCCQNVRLYSLDAGSYSTIVFASGLQGSLGGVGGGGTLLHFNCSRLQTPDIAQETSAW